jgi:predicted nucleic acid-binding protein
VARIKIYFSVLTKKELLKKPGLKDSERKKIISILSQLKIISIDSDISAKYSLLLTKYHHSQLQPPDAIIAATAWSKKLPLLTRNKKHFSYIQEIRLSPVYDQT